jgi:peptide/nickel transport system substrate-binding protein
MEMTRRTDPRPHQDQQGLTRRQVLGGAAALGAAFAGAASAFGAPAVIARQDAGTVIMVGEADLETLKVDTWGSLLANQAYRALYEPLVHYHTKPGPDDTLYYDPDNLDFRSAESVEIVDGGKILKWKIRPGQTFENGKPIDASAWEKTFHWNFDRQGVGMAQAQVNGTLTSKDDVYAEGDTLVMKFAEPNPWQVSSFFITNQAVVDVDEIMSHAGEDDPWGERWLEKNTVASGPYKLEKWVAGEQLVFTARPEYWAGEPQVKRLILRVVPDASVRFQLLTKGEVDMAAGISFKDLASLEGDPDITYERWRTNDWREVVLHWGMDQWDDPNIRRAVACAIPYDEILGQVFYDFAERVETPFGLLVEGADPAVWPYDFDLDRAREYLSQSSMPNGFEVTYSVATTDPIDEPSAILIKDALSQIGITLNLQKMTPVQLFDSLIKKNVSMAQTSFYSWVPDAGYHILWNFLPDSFANFGNWQNDEVQRIGEEAITMPLGDERNALLRQFQQGFADDVATVPFVSMPQIYPHSRRIGGAAYYPDSILRWDQMTVE